MKIRHILGKSWEKDVFEDNISFLLSNKLGDYLWFSEYSESRYQGWFFAPTDDLGSKIYKIIEDIKPTQESSLISVNNYFSKIDRERDGLKESFQLSQDSHLMRYSLNQVQEVELVLDVRDSYSGDYADYQIEEIKGKLLIKANVGNETIFLTIKGFENFERIEERFVRNYSFDKKRNSPPYERAVFKAIKMTGQNFVFSASKNKQESLDAVDKKITQRNLENNQEPVDFVSAKVGLKNLTTNKNRIYAGLPWFFQFWQRDEAISLGGLKIIDKQKAEDVFWEILQESGKGPKQNQMADGVGWTFKRAFLFLNSINKQKETEIAEKLRNIVDFNPKNILKINGPKETWMDSISRDGARIEIQSLWLSMYKLGRLIDEEKRAEYQNLEKRLKEEVRNLFWDGSVLADGYCPDKKRPDKTIRPNIFLAYYIYPELLSEEEWKNCFRRALYELWLDWGGLATISKEDSRYKPNHTGEISESYHQGDSWFFVNNLAAISMNRLDDGKFSYEINKILSASRENLMWQGTIGHASEVSSSAILKPEGAISQAWSFGTYLEALYEVFKIKNFNWVYREED